jgi:hypothetical protein
MQIQQTLDIIPKDFGQNSKVWIYQANRTLQPQEILEMNEQLFNFYLQWTSHGAPVKGWSQVLFNQFVVVLADEQASGVSGCSTDSMVKVIKSFERQYSITLFDRLSIAFYVKNKVEPLPYQQIEYALEKGYIQQDTPFFNNTVLTKQDLIDNWIIPLNQSWIWNKLSFNKN